MRIKRAWIVVWGLAIVGAVLWLLLSWGKSPGVRTQTDAFIEGSLWVFIFVGSGIGISRIMRADAKHYQRLRWERDGRCGGCGEVLLAGASVCEKCREPVAAHSILTQGQGGADIAMRGGVCASCDYPLAGVRGDRCPECGCLIPPPHSTGRAEMPAGLPPDAHRERDAPQRAE